MMTFDHGGANRCTGSRRSASSRTGTRLEAGRDDRELRGRFLQRRLARRDRQGVEDERCRTLASRASPKGTMTFKILFSDARAARFLRRRPDGGRARMTILTANGIRTVRLLQMDVSAVDPPRSTGWVFGTFAFQPTATETPALEAVAAGRPLMGQRSGLHARRSAAGKKLKQTTISRSNLRVRGDASGLGGPRQRAGRQSDLRLPELPRHGAVSGRSCVVHQ